MLWGSSRPGRGAEEFLVADLHRGRLRPSRAEGRGGGRRAARGAGTVWAPAVCGGSGPLPARARVARRQPHVKPSG